MTPWILTPALLEFSARVKVRKVYLTETSAAALRAWLDIRESMANPGEAALFVALDRAHSGGGMSARAIRYMLFSLNS